MTGPWSACGSCCAPRSPPLALPDPSVPYARPHRRCDVDPVVRAKLALRNIEDNLCFTDREAWAWFVLPTQPWAFRSDTQREQLLYGGGDALSCLAGHRLHLRVTTSPYPAAEWARRLDRRTPTPLNPKVCCAARNSSPMFGARSARL